ncbi:MAG: TatD family hydrolase, partial [Thermodesulfobacteriota bacterium]|nr:TatD family hydrolase [Thermodesulfobacteriota bacterium]
MLYPYPSRPNGPAVMGVGVYELHPMSTDQHRSVLTFSLGRIFCGGQLDFKERPDLQLIDSHCHLQLENFNSDREETLKRAREAGVVHVITIGIDVTTSAQAISLARGSDFISATAGFH